MDDYIQIGKQQNSNNLFISVPVKDGIKLKAPLSGEQYPAIRFHKKYLPWVIVELGTYLPEKGRETIFEEIENRWEEDAK